MQRNELDLTRLLSSSTSYDPANPRSAKSAATVDPDLGKDTTDEVSVGIDRELERDFGLSFTYLWARQEREPLPGRDLPYNRGFLTGENIR